MKEKITSTESWSRVCYETMETHARNRIQGWLQDLLPFVLFSALLVVLICGSILAHLRYIALPFGHILLTWGCKALLTRGVTRHCRCV
jgi:hypothetical protein